MKIRKSKLFKFLAFFITLNLIFEMSFPAISFALTGGPAQPETSSFQPIGMTDMVNHFTGDFSYNIPLFDIGGYPVNLAYQAGVGMDDEASWVGLGWNINAGVINRAMRGLPDDFDGDEVIHEYSMKPNSTWTIGPEVIFELLGYDILKSLSAKVGLNLMYNNYKGTGFSLLSSKNVSVGGLKANLSAGYGNFSGLSLDGNISFSDKIERFEGENNNSFSAFSTGTGFNSRSGLKYFNYGAYFRSVNEINPPLLDEEKLLKAMIKPISKINELSYNSIIPIGLQSYIPTVIMPYKNIGINFRASVGADAFGAHPAIGFSGSFHTQILAETSITKPAWGYIYTHNGKRNMGNLHGMFDFNREKDGVIHDETPNLPLTNMTYDVYNVNGHGVSGMFRPHRNDLSIMHDPYMKNAGLDDVELGVELGLGNLKHIGVDAKAHISSSETTLWNKNNNFNNFFSAATIGDPAFERFYFKFGGEMLPIDESHYSSLGKNKAVTFEIEKNLFGSIIAKNKLIDEYNDLVGSVSPLRMGTREPRSQLISYLNAKQASISKVALQTSLLSFPINKSTADLELNDIEQIPRYKSNPDFKDRKAHHISKFIITNPDGTRYVYGIPAYNIYQKDVTFSVNNGNSISGIAKYDKEEDNSISNKKGIDNYYQSTQLPAYARTYLLTAVLSPEYKDLIGDGISGDDLGAAVRFNYTRTSKAYNWRVPYEKDTANFNEGFKNDNTDYKASYVYGQKELWYLHSLESNTHIAEFKISPRNDGYGVIDENGGIGHSNNENRMYKLDSIIIYSKHDRLLNNNNAIPVKKIIFVYDYLLCKKIPNNKNTGEGKLTLKKLYITHGESGKGRLSPYEFYYREDIPQYNPDYDRTAYDRWGNYKPSSLDMPNNEFPYVNQKSNNLDIYAAAWSMHKLSLPSGGVITINYEANDYAYVQDQRSMQMVKLLGAADNKNSTNYEKYLYESENINKYLFFKLPQQVSNDDEFRKRYLNGIDWLYFKFYIDVSGRDHYEYVPGYCKIDKAGSGIHPNDPTVGYVKVKEIGRGDPLNPNAPVHPVSKRTWDFTRSNLPWLVYKGASPKQSGESVFWGIFSFAGELADLVTGPNKGMVRRGSGEYFDPSRSMIRLNNPSLAKKGGGSRVKSLYISDEWSNMTGGITQKYGQSFDYTIEHATFGKISSGVATYEPAIGGDENPFRQPVIYNIKRKFFPDETHFLEKPFGETFYPSPSIGYSQVTVRNIKLVNENEIEEIPIGKTVYEYYTAFDFPVKTGNTSIESLKSGDLGKKLFGKFYSNISRAFSQGYVIELNDMHGKLKRIAVYGGETLDVHKKDNLISENLIHYKENSFSNLDNKRFRPSDRTLDNTVNVLKSDGTIESRKIGINYDFFMDLRENTSKDIKMGLEVNSEGFIIPLVPVPIPLEIFPLPLPDFSLALNAFRTSVITKVIQRYGILESVEEMYNGSRSITKNVLYDEATGGIVLTQTSNEFGDDGYHFNHKAHLAYPGMGPAYKNDGVDLLIPLTDLKQNGWLLAPKNILKGGEKILINDYANLNNLIAWILDVREKDSAKDSVLLIDRIGNSVDFNYFNTVLSQKGLEVKVLESGRKNMLSASVGEITMLENPVIGNNLSLNGNSIVNSSVQLYEDEWKIYPDRVPRNEINCDPILNNVMQNIISFFKYTVEWHTYDESQYAQAITPVDFFHEAYLDTVNGFNNNLQPINLSKWPWFDGSNLKTTLINAYRDSIGDPNATPDNLYYGIRNIILNEVGSIKGFSFAFTSSDTIGSPSLLCEGKAMVRPFTKPDYKNVYSKFVRDSSSILFQWFKPLMYTSANFNYYCDPEFYNDKYELVLSWEDIFIVFDIELDCFPTRIECNINNNCIYILGELFNPFLNNIKNAWRPSKSLTYYSDRTHRFGPDSTHIRKDGLIKDYQPYWSYNNNQLTGDENNSLWVPVQEIVNYTPDGHIMETIDPVGNHSSRIYGYGMELVTAVASNAKQRQIGFDNFEDYTYPYMGCEKQPHWSFISGLVDEIECVNGQYKNKLIDDGDAYIDTLAHTGLFSLCIKPGKDHDIIHEINIDPGPPVVNIKDLYWISDMNRCITVFSPDTAHEYFLSGWIHEQHSSPNSIYTFEDAYANVKIYDNGNVVIDENIYPSGTIIEGWQRFAGRFLIPFGADSIQVTLVNEGIIKANYDDIRIHPYKSNMLSYVYHPVHLKVMAVLDENNYATFYEYDDEGNLIRIKKETERGIVTLQESRQGISKRP